MRLNLIKNLTIVGAGKMGKALISGWISNGLPKEELTIIGRDIRGSSILINDHIVNITTYKEKNIKSNILVLAVKPQIMPAVLKKIIPIIDSNTIIVSIAAGITMKSMRSHIGNENRIIRAMPNTPAAIGKGMTVLFSDKELNDIEKNSVTDLMAAVGEVKWVIKEDIMNLITAISGSGPAYFFYLTECLMNIAKLEGLDEELSGQLSIETFIGSASLVEKYKTMSIKEHRKNVTSPGGTTEAALNILMSQDILQDLMHKAVKSAVQRGNILSGE
ncbi:pyrroline-5-carboxylate reductase [Hyphomicrobiales bacterium]|nr:pyrroline-5-carboxylate reductase [Hyphomicrobiales bacterium]